MPYSSLVSAPATTAGRQGVTWMRMPKAVNQTYDSALKELVEKQKQKLKFGKASGASATQPGAGFVLLVVVALATVGILLKVFMG